MKREGSTLMTFLMGAGFSSSSSSLVLEVSTREKKRFSHQLLLCWILFWETQRCICVCNHFLTLRWLRSLKALLLDYKALGGVSKTHMSSEVQELELFKFQCCIKKSCLSMYGQDILCGISKVPFEIPHKISNPYIERWYFNAMLKI